MIPAKAYAAPDAKSPLAPWSFQRREVGPDDVLIDIKYCGVCHSDIHQARDEWGFSTFPMVPGHEIVGTVAKVGKNVRRLEPGDTVGVGCLVDSCRDCGPCKHHLEQFCEHGAAQTYNSTEMDRKTPTYGGYSDKVVVTQDFVLRIPPHLELAAVAPLLCAGITTYSPLRHWKVGRGMKVGIVGLGGLGHMGVKFAAAFGAETYVITTSPSKAADAHRLGAAGTIVSKDPADVKKHANSFDFILNTVAAGYDPALYLSMLKIDSTMAIVGAPDKPLSASVFPLIMGRKSMAGSLIGGLKETQEMLDYCGKHKIVSDVEIIDIKDINQAYERMIKGDVRYRFSIDMSTLPV